MEKRIRHYLHLLENKKLVLWGMGEQLEKVEHSLKRLGIKIDFFTATNSIGGFYHNIPILPYEKLDPKIHYVIISTGLYDHIIPLLKKRGFLELQDYYPWFEQMLHQDFLYDGIPIGRNTSGYLAYTAVLGENVAYKCVKSIGRFTTINNSRAYLHIDHAMNMLSQGFLDFIEKEDSEYYKKKYEKQIYYPPYNQVVIGHDVWVGAHTFINASKVKSIGNGAVIGAGAVVTKDVPPYAVVVGAPAKIIKYRFTEKQIEILERIQWWNWDEQTLRAHAECFYNPELFFEKYSS